MNERPALNGRPWQQRGFTSASAHPELIGGDLAIPPQRYVSMTSMNRSIGADRRRAAGGLFALLAIAVLLTAVAFRSGTPSDDNRLEKQQLARACMQWHLAAGAVVSRLVNSTRDADLLLVSDSVFRMRRARRNCEAGWVTLACQDYHAVVASTPGYAMTNQTLPCSRIAAYERD
jgi:hypothetical protein